MNLRFKMGEHMVCAVKPTTGVAVISFYYLNSCSRSWFPLQWRTIFLEVLQVNRIGPQRTNNWKLFTMWLFKPTYTDISWVGSCPEFAIMNAMCISSRSTFYLHTTFLQTWIIDSIWVHPSPHLISKTIGGCLI